jgi:hypothetical protein
MGFLPMRRGSLAELALEESEADVELLELAVRAAWSVGLREQALREAEEAETQGDWVWPVERVRELVNRMAATAERSGWYDWLGYAEDVRAAILVEADGDLIAARAMDVRAAILVEADGDLIAARAILNRQHRTEGELSSPHRFWAMMTGAELALESGDVQEATRLIERAGSSPLASSDQERRVSSLAAEVRLALRTRRRDESARLLQRMAELISRDETARARSFVIWFRTLREALRAGLEPERALACYREALVERGRRREPVAVADGHQGIARCLLVLRRYDETRRGSTPRRPCGCWTAGPGGAGPRPRRCCGGSAPGPRRTGRRR